MTGAPDVWTDGSLVQDQVTGISSSGAGFFAHQSEECWSGCRWGHADHVRPDGGVQSCRGFCSVPGPCSLFRELKYGVSFWLCKSSGVVGPQGVILHFLCIFLPVSLASWLSCSLSVPSWPCLSFIGDG